MIGTRYFSWTVKEKQKNIKQRAYGYLCICKCGQEQWIRTDHLINGKSEKCRKCSNKEKAEKNLKHGYARRNKNGFTRSNTYNSWALMMRRCYKTYDPFYKNYGKRGIKVCERWHQFPNFLKDMGNAPQGFYIDRIDVNKGYFLENCRWVSPQESAKNTRRNIYYTVNGIKMIQLDIQKKYNISWYKITKLRKQYGVKKTIELLEKRVRNEKEHDKKGYKAP